MNCKISCSFGEIVDKVTILKIKQKKASDKHQLNNITKELTTIQTENPMVNEKDDLFDLLSNINQKLWGLEDNIREKSRKKEFDKTYIEYAEQIHIQNDERYRVKRQINEKYNSLLKEEKIYKHLNKENNIHVELSPSSIDMKDQKKLQIGKKLFTDGHYKECMECIQKIMNKYKDFKEYNSFFVDLLFSYSNITSIFNYENKYVDKIFYIMKQLKNIEIPKAQKKFCISIFTTLCLQRKEYLHKNSNIAYINYINGPGISPNNMSFFDENDENKTLIIYDGGGIGDKFMLGRLIFILIDRYVNEKNKNKITFIVQDNILWFMKELLKDYLHFIRFVSDKKLYFVGDFDYHCSLLSLIKYLKIDYDTLAKTFIPFCNKFNTISVNDNCKKIMDSIKPNTYIINWKGNPNNPHEKHNRMMNLINAFPLFKIQSSNIHWLVISKDLTKQEHKILKKHNISYIGNRIDKQKAYYDTISILQHKNISGVISTDTSLPHLSLSLGIKTYVLLTLGCEWRWTQDEKTNWYPDAILLRQKIHGDWRDPIQKLVNLLHL